MEPPQKRQRLLEPADSNRNDKHLGSASNHQDFDVEDDYEEFDEAEEDFDDDGSDLVFYDDGDRHEGFDLTERRARVDQKLKSNWEKLFEKFSKDFTGIGDEIDLATGEIVVDNGHLKSMNSEKDIGDSIGGRRLLRALTVEPEGLSALVPGKEVEEGIGNSGSTSENEYQDAEETIQTSVEQNQEHEILGLDSTEPQDLQLSPRNDSSNSEGIGNSTISLKKDKALPSREEILERFGEFGPQVIRLLDQRHENHNQASIEPAWRFPELPSQISGKRPLLQSIFLQETDNDRSPSPEQGTSLWSSPSRKRKRRVSQRLNSGLEEENGSHWLDSLSDVGSPSQPERFRRKKNKAFSDQDDEILFAAMTKYKKQGIHLYSKKIYDQIAIEHPQHSAKEWYDRWYRTRRQPNPGNHIAPAPGSEKEWKFDGLEWINKNSVLREKNLELHTSRTVEYIKRVFHTERPGTGDTQETGVQTFVGVLISETNRERTRTISGRIEEISSHQLGQTALPFHNEESDTLKRSSNELRSALVGDRLLRSRMSTKQMQAHLTKSLEHAPKAAQTASEDLFQKLKSVYARPVRSKNLSLLQLLPGEQYVSIVDGDNEYHVRLIACPHLDCKKSSKLYKGSRTSDNGPNCEFEMHLRDDHDVSMYPCLEAGCNRKGGSGFRRPGNLISHVKAEHDYKRAWNRLKRVIDTKTFALNGIYFDERKIDSESVSDGVDELQDESSGLGIQLKSSVDRNREPERNPIESTHRKVSSINIRDAKNSDPLLSSSTSKQLMMETDSGKGHQVMSSDAILENQEATSLITASTELPDFVEVVSATAEIGGSLGTDSSPKSLPHTSFSGNSDALIMEEPNSNPITVDSSPPSRSFHQNMSIYEPPIELRSDESLANPVSSEPTIPNQIISSPPRPFTPKEDLALKRPVTRGSSILEDSDDLDELSIFSPSLSTSLMTTHSLSNSRTPSRLSSPFPHKQVLPSTPHRVKNPGHPRHSLPMSAIPSRTIQKTTRQSLSGYKPPSPSKLRKMFMPTTPTRKTAKKGITTNSPRKIGGEIGDVFKTPGGTLRRCGLEGFACRREFCFRCLSGQNQSLGRGSGL